MAKWCRTENDTVIEIIGFDPKGRFVKELEDRFVKCPQGTKQGDIFINGVLTPKEAIEPTQEQIKSSIIQQIKQTDLEIIRLIEDIALWAEGEGFEIPMEKKVIFENRNQLRERLKTINKE